jgi:type IV pilus assembly protein PilC
MARGVLDAARVGESLATPLGKHTVFLAMVVQMLAVGEETGALNTMLSKIADFYDQEVEAAVEALTSLIEPILIAVMGGAVGSMVIAPSRSHPAESRRPSLDEPSVSMCCNSSPKIPS